MDQLARYRAIIREVLEGYAEWHRKPDGSVRADVLYDPSRDAFALIYQGWERHRRVHNMVFHLELIGGQVWVQWDATNRPIAVELVRAGIPREDIILGEKPPDMWEYTDYGVPRSAARPAGA